jgi:hypothetical protein
MTTGIVLTSAALPIALMAAFVSDKAYQDCISDLPANHVLVTAEQAERGNDCRSSQKFRAYAIAGTAIAMIGVGIPLIVYGAKKVPNAEQAMLTPWLSPTSAGAILRLPL